MRIPYVVGLRVTLSASSEGSVQFQNSANQSFEIHTIMQRSTDTFDIIDFSDNASQQYSPASNSNPVDGSIFPDSETDTDSPRELPLPLTLRGQDIIKFTLLDTSAASNVVDIMLMGILDTQKG